MYQNSIKYGIISLFIICNAFQNVIVDILKKKELSIYPPSFVFYCEFSKWLITLICIIYYKSKEEIIYMFQNDKQTLMKISIPAACFVLQNNIAYMAILSTDAPTFQLWSNTKIIFTAIWMTLLLKKQIKNTQWISLFQICLSLSMTSLQKTKFQFGILYVLMCSFISGFSSTYSEFLLKEKSYSFLCITFYMYTFCWITAAPFYKYNLHEINLYSTIMLILNITVGMSISLIMKHANNIIKLFSTFISLIISSIVANICCSFYISKYFIMSSISVCAIIVQYNLLEEKKSASNEELIHLKQNVENT